MSSGRIYVISDELKNLMFCFRRLVGYIKTSNKFYLFKLIAKTTEVVIDLSRRAVKPHPPSSCNEY